MNRSNLRAAVNFLNNLLKKLPVPVGMRAGGMRYCVSRDRGSAARFYEE